MKKVFLLICIMFLPAVLLACSTGQTGDTSDAVTTADTTAKEEPMNTPVLENGAVYGIKNAEGFAVSGETFGTVNGEKTETRGYREDLDQLWRAHVSNDGSVMLENLSSGLILSIRMFSDSENAKSVLAEKNEKHAQHWLLEKADNGYFLKCVGTSGLLTCNEPAGVGYISQTFEKEKATVWTVTKEAEAETEFPRILRLSGDNMAPASCPEIFKFNGVYYNINMTAGMRIKRSEDLINWTLIGSVFDPKPAWIKKEIGSDSIWAPGFYTVNGQLRVYYCASSSGSQNSLIGMAYADTPESKFRDGGMVIRSQTGDPYNCIDPCVFTDDDGKVYLIFGSYWTGIYMRRLDPETGLLHPTDTQQWHLAEGTKQMEAPYLIKRDGYYYLFVAMGNLSKNNNYHWCVGRSESLFGPYVDKNGRPMLENKASRLTEYKPGVEGTAHASVFKDDDGQYYMVSEMWQNRSDPDRKIQLFIGTIVWNDKGWPVTPLASDLLGELEGKK